jgi:hypothetical protein
MFRLRRYQPGIWTNAAAGLAGGLAASWAMGVFNQLLSKLSGTANEHEGGQDSTVQVAEAVSQRVFRSQISAEEKALAGPAVHFTFGATMGALYGVLTGKNPHIAAGTGVPFGIAIWAGAHVTAVPALGLSKPPLQKPLAGEAIELASHVVYGAATDTVRRIFLRTARAFDGGR